MSAITTRILGHADAAQFGFAYPAIWRWHFYAGLFCLPFIGVLARLINARYTTPRRSTRKLRS